MAITTIHPIISVHSNDPKPSLWITYLTKQSFWCVNKMDKFEPYDRNIEPDADIIAALEKDPSPENIDAFVEEVMRSNHFCLLNALPAVVGTKWPITESIYWYFLEILPPLDYRKKTKGFAMCEAKTGNIRSAYYLEAGQYWHEYVELEGRD